MFDEALAPRKNPSVVERRGNELLLFNTDLGTLYEVNETGNEIWLLCDGRHTIAKMKTRLLRSYGRRKPIDQHLNNFIKRLAHLGLVKLSSSVRKNPHADKKGQQGARQHFVRGTENRPYKSPTVRKLWSEKSATSNVFLVEI